MYWHTEISTLNFEDVTIEWHFRSTGTGPRDFQLQYRLENENWNNVGEPIVIVNVGGNPASINAGSHFTRTLPVSAQNQPTVELRWIITSSIGVNGNPIAAAGTNQIGNIRISGMTVVTQASAPISSSIDVSEEFSHEMVFEEAVVPEEGFDVDFVVIPSPVVPVLEDVVVVTAPIPTLESDVMDDMAVLCALLRELILEGQGLNQEDFTAESWRVFIEALAFALTTYYFKTPTVQDLRLAIERLRDAIDGLVPVDSGQTDGPDAPERPNVPGQPDAPNRPSVPGSPGWPSTPTEPGQPSAPNVPEGEVNQPGTDGETEDNRDTDRPSGQGPGLPQTGVLAHDLPVVLHWTPKITMLVMALFGKIILSKKQK